MTVASTRVGGLLALLVLATACESNKSANPLSPSVAGPIPGVEISAPKPLEPGVNWEVSNDKQPLALLIENPGSTGQRPVTLDVEVASDEGFATKVFAKAGVEPGPNGRTQLQLPSKLTSDRTYFWRAKGQDGANSGPWSAAVRFSIYTPSVLRAPTPRSPIGGETGGRPRPAIPVQKRRPVRRHRPYHLSRRHLPQRLVYPGRGHLHGRRGWRRGQRDDRGIGLEPAAELHALLACPRVGWRNQWPVVGHAVLQDAGGASRPQRLAAEALAEAAGRQSRHLRVERRRLHRQLHRREVRVAIAARSATSISASRT